VEIQSQEIHDAQLRPDAWRKPAIPTLDWKARENVEREREGKRQEKKRARERKRFDRLLACAEAR